MTDHRLVFQHTNDCVGCEDTTPTQAYTVAWDDGSVHCIEYCANCAWDALNNSPGIVQIDPTPTNPYKGED